MLDLLKGQLRFWKMESTKTSRGRRGAERMQPAGSRKGRETSLAKEIPGVMTTAVLAPAPSATALRWERRKREGRCPQK